MEIGLTIISAVLVGALSSSGMWAYFTAKDKKKNATTRLIMGIASVKISEKGLDYITRGAITRDEYDDFRKYLFEPYKELGGNGTAERIMGLVSNLPFRTDVRTTFNVHILQQGDSNADNASQ